MTSARATLLKRIQVCDFALNDAALYLDTHPDDQLALDYYKRYAAMKNEAWENYVQNYGPLMQSDYDGGNTWNWVDGPWPWDKEANN